jgi:hypothetical protein
MDHATVANNSAGGIFIDGAAFDIHDTTVTSNGPGMLGLATWGGILVNNPPVDGPAKLDYVTLQSNPVGVSCSGPITGTNVSVSGSASGVDITTTCGFVSCGAPSSTCGAQP